MLTLEFASNGVVRYQCLTGTGRCTYENVDALVDGFDGVKLEAIESEAKSLNELSAIVENAHLCSSLPTAIARK